MRRRLRGLAAALARAPRPRALAPRVVVRAAGGRPRTLAAQDPAAADLVRAAEALLAAARDAPVG
jgi:hypothetical protein